MSDVIYGAVELNGPTNLQVITQMFESGQISAEEYVEQVKELNQCMYDYICQLRHHIRPDAPVPCWHVVRERSLSKRMPGDYIVKE
jgi:hypothetical protein